MYHKPRMCRTCLQMSRGDFKFVNLDCVDPLWESNSPNLKDQLIYVIPEMKLDTTEAYICTSCFIALRTAYEFKRMCQVTEQKFQSYNYKYRRPFGVGPGSPQFHVSLSENGSTTPNFRCQNLNYLQSDTSIDITEHHLYDASKVLPRKQLAYLNNVTQKLPEIDVEVVVNQTNSEKQTNAEKKTSLERQTSVEKQTTKDSTDSKTNSESKDKILASDKKDDKAGLKEGAVVKSEKKDTIIEKQEENIAIKDIPKEEKLDSKQEKNESALPQDIKLDPKSGNITFPNLPGIEIVPRKLDSTAIRKKYNIGSQISILKTPKYVSAIETVVKRACEEISYLKTNNILPEALNCSVHLEYLSSAVTMNNTSDKQTIYEMKAIANLYYSESANEILTCKSCDKFFSTTYWLKVHEEEHENDVDKQFMCDRCPATFIDDESLQDHIKQHYAEKEAVNSVQSETSTDTISKIAVPLLGNDQISLTPIPKEKRIVKGNVDQTEKNELSHSAKVDTFEVESCGKIELSNAKENNQVDSPSPLPSPDRSSPFDEKEELPVEEEKKIKAELEQLSTSISKSESEDLETSLAKIKRRNRVKLLKRQFKSLFKKKICHLNYFRCFICLKLFKTKFVLNQHCKYVHIPNTLDSNYWSNVIKAQKASRSTSEDVKEEVDNVTNDNSQVVIPETNLTHVRTAKSNLKVTYACNICDKRVAEKRFLELHMYVHTPTFVCMDPNIAYNKHGDVFKCYLCEKAFPKERYLKLHNLQVHLSKTIICKICNREFKSDFWYSQHKCVIPTEAPEPEPPVEDENNQFPCTVCNRKFARLRFMKSHRHRMHKDVNEDGTPKTKREISAKASNVYGDSDDNEDSNYESENEFDTTETETKESDKSLQGGSSVGLGDRTLNLNELGSRRSLSRGVPKIQCDFCGDYIEETVYDKHIFEHNKLRLDRSLSKRKSLDSSFISTPEKKQEFMKCPVCSKPFKRKYNLNVHISKYHEGVETLDVSELNETVEDEEKYLSDSENSQKEPPEIVYGQISLIDGIEIYECCERTFRLKAHFYRHFKIKHPNCTFKPIYIDQNPLIDTKSILEPIITIDEGTDKELNDKCINLSEAAEQNLHITEEDHLFKDDCTNDLAQKEMRKRGRRRKINALAENIADDEETGNINEFMPIGEERPSKRQRVQQIIADDKSVRTATSDESEDMEATAHHLRQLDLLPVVSKNAFGRYECHICERRFKQKCQLRDHFNVHTGDKPYKCDFCNPVRGFTQTSSLYVHIRRVHAVVMKNCIWEVYSKNGSCIICSEIFDKHSHMFQHLKDHYLKKEFECQECHKNFHMSCHYKVHNINPEDMQHLLADNSSELEEDEESELEQDSTVETLMLPIIDDEKVESDSDSSSFVVGGCDETKPSKCTKCSKAFPNKEQLRFHKKSLAHIQQIEAIRSKVSENSTDEMEEDSLKTDSEAMADIENGVKAIIKKIRTFKKHRCNLCGASFGKRIHLKKHKRKHKMRRAYMKVHEDSITTDVDENPSNIEMQDTSSNTNTLDSNETEKVLEITPSSSNPIEMQVPADTEIISITTTKSLETTAASHPRCAGDVDDLPQLSDKKQDGESATDEFGSFDVILKIAESTSELNKQFLFKHTSTTNKGINFDVPNSTLNLHEDLSSRNTIIELPDSTITYINPNQSDISLLTTDHPLTEECKDDMSDLDITIEVSKCTELPLGLDNKELKKSCSLNIDDLLEDELSSTNIDNKNFYSSLTNDLVILPISENVLANTSKPMELSSPLNDLSFHIVESPTEETRSALTLFDLKTSDSVPKEQCNLQTSISQLEIHEVDSTFIIQPPASTVSDKCFDLGE
uniref:Uncharacterized protein n=1 Tax=Photinus pyralis TaxID=7054 RepID=A0A1Y1K5I5_PHOPY